MSTLKIPNMLSYNRSINPTDALMSAFSSKDPENTWPVLVEERGTRSPFSNYNESKSVEKNPARGNPKRGDVAMIPVGCDTLQISFSVAFSGASMAPNACSGSHAEVRDALLRLTHGYAKGGGYEVLARYYVGRLISGDVAWRNADIAEVMTIDLSTRKHQIRCSIENGEIDVVSGNLEGLIDEIAKALANPKGLVRVHVNMALLMDERTEVFPSQVFEENAKKKKLASVTLSGDQGRQAMMHNQKIGNAIRQIDSWYGDKHNQAPYPIAVEPFGIDRSLDQAVRIEAKRDFYTLMKKQLPQFVAEVESEQSPDTWSPDMHYFVACLIRGGVFSGKDD